MSAVASPTDVFRRILCAVDESDESAAAALQASRLLAEDGSLELVAVAETHRAVRAGWSSPQVAARIRQEAADALERAAQLSPDASTLLARGHAANVLLHEAEARGATLLAVGAARPPRARERLLGNVADDIVRRASCSVLVARRRPLPAPSRIVCGVDGSRESLVAAEVADGLARRFEIEVDFVTALGGKPLDLARLGRATRLNARSPVDALTDAALDADLVVVGSRGLHSVLSLGSVGARVAARADCSVLVVRGV
jgi:nucleotide-binding universal stress UspA family protein